MNVVVQTFVYEFWVLSFEFWVLNCRQSRFWILNFEFWIVGRADLEFWVLNFEFWIVGKADFELFNFELRIINLTFVNMQLIVTFVRRIAIRN